MTEYTLPDLPYDYGALEPHLSARILELHHGKHHAAYVTGEVLTIDGGGWLGRGVVGLGSGEEVPRVARRRRPRPMTAPGGEEPGA